MFLSYCSAPIGSRRRAAYHVGWALYYPAPLEALVEPVGRFAKIAAKIFFPYGAVGAMRGVLDIAQHRIRSDELFCVQTARAAFRLDAPMWAGFHNHPKAVQATGGYLGTQRQMPTCPAQLKKCVSVGCFRTVLFEKIDHSETFLKLNHIPCHFVSFCSSDVYKATRLPFK